MNQYPLWRYLLLFAVLLVGGLYALPNIFPQDPALQISERRGGAVDISIKKLIENTIAENKLQVKAVKTTNKQIEITFRENSLRRQAAEVIREKLGDDYVVAFGLAPTSPSWLSYIGAKPMYMGLDLRGGVHFLLQVDTSSVETQNLDRLISELRAAFREESIRYRSIRRESEKVKVVFLNPGMKELGKSLLKIQFKDLALDFEESESVDLVVNEEAMKESIENALQQNLTTLRNRVNEFGVSEPVIQRQGASRVVVQLPGVEDTALAKKILGATATLEFRMVFLDGDPRSAERSGRTPIGAKLLKERDGSPVLVEKRVLLTGKYVIDASSGLEQQSGSPAVFVTLDGKGARIFSKATRERIGKPMAVVFIEQRDGRAIEEVINIATIRDQLSKRFQISGLESTDEARTLALLLRAGSLAAPMEIIQERTIGPSLGSENIRMGVQSTVLGMALVLVFMAIYYRGFGLIANVALLTNFVLIIALLSMLQATLTLPGIAGIVLTVGMAVDANVLIFQRVREELANGNSPQMSISAGYNKAFSTIADANVTTLIAAIVLFSFGTGPIKGFAVTLSLGILTSMFTAIMGTRAVVNLVYGKKKLKDLNI